MILFEELTYKNFLSTGNVPTTIYLNKSPMTLVIGVNGAGKSTFLDALTFVLFGKSFRGINLPNLVNSINEKELFVSVKFTIGRNKYKVERGIKPAIFNIYCNDVLVPQDARKGDYQNILENHILKMNLKAFKQIVILGSSSFEPFMQLVAADRRDIIEDLLDIEIFSSMNIVVKTKLAEIYRKLDESKIKQDSTLARIELQKKYVEEAKKNNSLAIEQKRKEWLDLDGQIKILMADVVFYQNQDVFLLEEVAERETLQSKISKLSSYEIAIEKNIRDAKKHLKFYTDNDTCPTCEQNLELNFKNNAIQTANTQLHEFNEGLEKLSIQLDLHSKRMDEIEKIQIEINDHQREVTRINASISQIQLQMNKLMEEIKELENKKVLSDDMLAVSEQLVKDLADINTLRKDLSESKKYYDIAATLLKDNGIKTKIIRQYLPIINKLVNKYLGAMDFFVSFELDEEFKETIKSRYRDDFRYENFSEGERMRIDLALLFTWRTIAKLKNSMNTNLLILDEVFDSSLDSSGTEEFMKLLDSLGTEANVFVISHKGDILIDKFKNIIKFSKIKDFSFIE
jgi:DNA repair exonuclease SbcCD ATPase subunit